MTDLGLTDLQLHILDVLWSRPEATVIEVQDALRPERALAHSTVATLLARLERKGLVTHRTEGRQYIYRASVPRSGVRRSVVAELASVTRRLFDGDVAELVSHLLTDKDVDSEDLDRVRKMITARQRALRAKKGGRP